MWSALLEYFRLLSRISFFKISIDGGRCAFAHMWRGLQGELHRFREHALISTVAWDAWIVWIHARKSNRVQGALEKSITASENNVSVVDSSRRTLKNSAGGMATLAGLWLLPDFCRGRAASRNASCNASRGDQLWHFTQKCTACQLCISSCRHMFYNPHFSNTGSAGYSSRKWISNGLIANMTAPAVWKFVQQAHSAFRAKEKQLIQIGIAILKRTVPGCWKTETLCEMRRTLSAKAIDLQPTGWS